MRLTKKTYRCHKKLSREQKRDTIGWETDKGNLCGWLFLVHAASCGTYFSLIMPGENAVSSGEKNLVQKYCFLSMTPDLFH